MFKKILSLLLFLIVVANCDYSPVYLKSENSKLNIDIIKIDGDSEIKEIIVKARAIIKVLKKFFIFIWL